MLNAGTTSSNGVVLIIHIDLFSALLFGKIRIHYSAYYLNRIE